MEVDYFVTGSALFLGIAAATLVAFFWLLRTGRIPRVATVVAIAALITAVLISVAEAGIPH